MNTAKKSVSLKGTTWNHTRGLVPMVATGQRFSEVRTNVEINWHKRSLQAFADAPLAKLVENFDLLVIDHPSIGEAAEEGLLMPLDEWLPADYLRDQADHSVGDSHLSYLWKGHQYALAIDAATPVAGWRPDLMAKADAELPQTWDELLGLARRGLVTVPAIAIDSLMNFYMLANALGSEPFASAGAVVSSRTSGVEALKMLRELVKLAAEGSLERNPIKTWQMLADSESVAYCPFAYGYSNYAGAGYAANTLKFGGLITVRGRTLRSTLGGAGLAISRRCQHVEEAVAYAKFVASAGVQRGLYGFSGGQPGNRVAWEDESLNEHTGQYFRDTLATLDDAWVRPRGPGSIAFQDEASKVVHAYLVRGGDENAVLNDLDTVLTKHMPRGVSA